MAAAIETFFEQASENQVALIIMDYKMPGMTGTELIKQVKRFLGGENVKDSKMPRFAFKAQLFWELPPETVREILDLGVKTEDVIDKFQNKK